MAKGYPGRRRSADAYWKGVDSSGHPSVMNPYANPHLAKVFEQGRKDGQSGRWADNPAPPRPKPKAPKPKARPAPRSARPFGRPAPRGLGRPGGGQQPPRRSGGMWDR